MTNNDFYNYFYKVYWNAPLSAQVSQQNKIIFHLKMELAKLKKKVSEISKTKKED